MFLGLIALALSAPYISKHDEKAFLSWMRETNQLFIGDEYQFRFGIWSANKRLVQEHNSGSKSFKVSLNRLSALTQAEYRSLLGLKVDLKKKRNIKKSNKKLPDSVDWRNQGVVNAIQDQGQCGSCWAFSAIQTIESLFALNNGGKLYKLSEQNIVDCVVYCYGCDGGWMDDAFDYVIDVQKGAVNLLSDYPYTAYDGSCKFDASKAVTVLADYIDIEEGSEDDLADKVANNGPVAIAIDASNWSFQLYTSGIYDEPDCSSEWLDHGVGAIGYGTEGGVNYWLVRNSWGLDWGENGYIRMVKNKNNQCGEATAASVAVPVTV
jgi:cathepsin L